MLSVYDFPQAYEAVLPRPEGVVSTEVKTILQLLERYGIHDGALLELACGACAHGIRLAQAGFQVVGVDRAPAMLAKARRRAARAGVAVRTVQGDMVGFSLDQRGFDAAVFLFETFPLIAAYADVIRHFEAVRRHLRHGGVYVVDVDWPRGDGPTEAGEWGRRTLPLPGGWVEAWYEDLAGDPGQPIQRLVLHCRIHVDGAVHETRDEWAVRRYQPDGLARLAQALDGWELGGLVSWRDGSEAIADEDHYLALFVAY
jgi:SAM-dependent methyltransferase